MPLLLPRERTAIVVVECQNDLLDESNIGKAGISKALAATAKDRQLLAKISGLLTTARQAGVPVVYANKESKPGIPVTSAPIFRIGRRFPILQEGTWGAQVHSAIAPKPGDHVLRRFLAVDPSGDSSLFATLRALNRDLIVAMGVSTNFAVEGMVRGAVNNLFEVVVVEDCCASVPHELHRFSVERILPLLATVSGSTEVNAALEAARADQ